MTEYRCLAVQLRGRVVRLQMGLSWYFTISPSQSHRPVLSMFDGTLIAYLPDPVACLSLSLCIFPFSPVIH